MLVENPAFRAVVTQLNKLKILNVDPVYKLKPTEDITKEAVFTKNAAGQITGFNFNLGNIGKESSLD